MVDTRFTAFNRVLEAREQSQLARELDTAESLIMQGEYEHASELLRSRADDAESYVAANCSTTPTDQWFCFSSFADKLAYQRCEHDERQLHDSEEPLCRLYNDLALAWAYLDEKELFREALKQVIRWNPMDCQARLSVADVYRILGNIDEFAALSVSVIERASDVRHLASAYTNMALYLRAQNNMDAASAAMHAAKMLDAHNSQVDALLHEVADSELDADRFTDDEARDLLQAQGVPYGANANVLICLLMSAYEFAKQQQTNEATKLLVRATHLVGQQMVMQLYAEIRAQGEAGDVAAGR